MPAMILLDNNLAWVIDGEWYSSDEFTLAKLNSIRAPGGDSPANGDGDVYAAEQAKKVLGAGIVDLSPMDTGDIPEIEVY